jgi:hypothetical protein
MERQAPRKSGSSMALVWTSHLASEEEKADFLKQMASSNTQVMRRLLDIVQGFKTRAGQTALSKANYESPSWAYIQADSVGYQRALQEIEQLLKGIVR